MIRLSPSSLKWLLLASLIVRPLFAEAGGVRFFELDVSLQGGFTSVVSPDGAHVYVTGGNGNEIWVHATSGNGIDDTVVQVLTVADDPTSIAISPDGAHVHVTSRQGIGSLQVFTRDTVLLSPTFGQLTLLETQVDDANSVPEDTMRKPQGVVVSPDDAHVYVVTVSDNSIVVFTRQSDPMLANYGKLTFLEVQQQTPGSCDVPGGVCGLGDARTMAISPDGKSLYAGGKKGDAKSGVIAVFSRDEDDMSANYGKLTFEERVVNLENGITQLHRPETLVVSPDDAHVYSASGGGNAVHVFARGLDGTLTQVEFQKDGGSTPGLGNASGIATDGVYVYVVAAGDDAISVFRRNASTGKLTILETKFNGTPALPGTTLANPRDAQLSPDGTHLYVVTPHEALVSFVIDECGDNIRGPDQQCDDPAPAENGDGCSATCRLEVCDMPTTGCTVTHLAAAESAALTIKNDPAAADSKDQLQWKFSLGTVALGGFGDPRKDEPTYDSYVLCVYDGNDVLLMSNVAPKGGPSFTCKKGDHCWATSPAPKPTTAPGNVKQYKYGDKSSSPDGLQQVILKTGIGNAKLQVKGKGANLATPVLPMGGLTLPVKAIMKSTVSETCWSSTFHSIPLPDRIIQNDGVRFKAKNTN